MIDIETENTGYDIIEHNTRILSIQLNDGIKEELFYADSTTNNLALGRTRIQNAINNDTQFVGYNIKNFDLPLLKKFEDIEIPKSQIIDISELKKMIDLKSRLNKRGISLEDACGHFGVTCSHKALLRPISERIKKSPEIIQNAKMGGAKIAEKNRWTLDFCINRALEKISGGMAILESYNDFVKSQASPSSIFYQYAIGDVISEYGLYQKVKGG